MTAAAQKDRQHAWRAQWRSGLGCLRRGQWLRQGLLSSPSGQFTLSHRPDGELLLSAADGRAVWSVGSAGIPPGGLTLLPDGDLVLFDRDGWPVWSSGTVAQPVEWLLITDDAILVLLDREGRVRWTSDG